MDPAQARGSPGLQEHPAKLPPERAVPVAGTLMGVGDVIAQQLVEQRGLHGHQGTRTARMMTIGFCFVVSSSVGWQGEVGAASAGWGHGAWV